jgi:hypothetical protein
MGNIGMEILKFENAPAPRKTTAKKSNLKSLAGLATVAAVAVLGSTLAANISLGTGSTLEFGQGVQVTAACDNAITLSPKVNFVNGAEPVFMLSTISFSDLDGRDIGQSEVGGGTGCATRTLTLNAYGDVSAIPLQIATGSSSDALTQATIGITGSAGTPTTSDGFVVANTANLGTATSSFDLGITTPSATSGAVYKLTLQSN